MRISKYTPSLLASQDLESIFVQRHKLAEQLVELVRESVLSKSKHYTLLIGPRGIGKTHLIALVYHRVVAGTDLENDLVIAWLREEEWGIGSFLDLVLRILRSLQEAYPQSELVEQVTQLYALSPKEAEQQSVQFLKAFLGERTLLLLMENLDDIFSGLGDEGQKKLRSFLQETGCCTIIATSQSLFNGVKLQTSPFYGFFRIRHLKDLSVDDAIALLTKVAELEGNQELVQLLASPKGRSRVQAVHHLAGGNPRIYVVFSEFLNRESLDELIQPFMQMLDDLTPYYQARMSWLSPQQRKIIEVLCSRKYGMQVKEIAQWCFATPQTVSSQLKDLRDKGYVLAEIIGRQSFYELREPLMRICLAVKQVRREPIKLIVDFLRTWYTRQKLQAIYQALTERQGDSHQLSNVALSKSHGELKSSQIKQMQWNSPLNYFKLALEENIGTESNPKVTACVKELAKHLEENDYKEGMKLAQKLKQLRGNDWDFSILGFFQGKLGHHEEAFASFDNAIVINPNNVDAWFLRGISLFHLSRHEETVTSCDKVVKLNPEHVKAWSLRGISLVHLSRYEEAITSYDIVIQLNSEHADAWFFRGSSLVPLSRYEEAIASFDKAVELNPNNDLAWHLRGVSLGKLSQYEEANANFDKAIELNPDDALVWSNRGISLVNLGQYEEAIASFDKAVELNPDNDLAWYLRGNSWYRLGQYKEAIANYDKAIEINPGNALAWNNRGIALVNLGRFKEAIASYDKAIEKNPDDALAWKNRGIALVNLGRFKEAITSFNKVIEIDPNDTWVKMNRAELLFSQNIFVKDLKKLEIEIQTLTQAELEEGWQFDIGINAVFQRYQEASQWKKWLKQIIETFEKYNFLNAITQGLTEQSKKLASEMVSQTAAESWRDVWQELVGDRPEFQIPLRLLNATIEYKKAPNDPRVFLALPIEERKILKQLLNISGRD